MSAATGRGTPAGAMGAAVNRYLVPVHQYEHFRGVAQVLQSGYEQ